MSYLYRSFVLLVCTIISHSKILSWQWAGLGILSQRDPQSQNAAKPFKFIMFTFPWLTYWYTFVLLAPRCISTAENSISFISRFLWPHQKVDVKIPGVFAAVTLGQLWIERYRPLCAQSHGVLAGSATHQAAALPICAMDSINGAPVMAVIGSNPQSRQSLILLNQKSLSPVPRYLFPADAIL